MADDDFDAPDFDDVAILAARGVVAEMHTSFPARIIKYDRASFTASIQPVLRGRRWDPVERAYVTYLPKPVHGVRVVQHLTDAGGLVLPYKQGDYVWCECAERSLAEWRASGGDDVTPADPVRFDLSDAVVTGPIRAAADAPPADSTHDDNPVLSGDPVLLGDATATDDVALAPTTKSHLDSIVVELNKIILYVNGIAPGTAVLIPVPLAAIAATKVKAK